MSSGRPKRPRRKAKQARSRETIEVVLEAAARVLADHGYAAASTNRIAERAGVSIGTLYEYFADKDAVFEALIERELAAIVAAIRGVEIDPAAPVDEVLARVLAAAMGAMHHGPELVRSLEQVPGARFQRRLGEARRVVIEFARALLAAHRDELRVADLDLAAFVLVSAAEGVGANATSDVFDQRLARELTTLLRRYLTGGP